MSINIKSPVPRLIIKDFSPINRSKPRIQTPPLHFPVYPKFSNQLFGNLPPLNVGKVVSYSSLLTCQVSSPSLEELPSKKQVTTYKSPSRINEKKTNTISLQKIQFNQDIIKPRKSPSITKPRKIIKMFKATVSKHTNLKLVSQQLKILKKESKPNIT